MRSRAGSIHRAAGPSLRGPQARADSCKRLLCSPDQGGALMTRPEANPSTRIAASRPAPSGAARIQRPPLKTSFEEHPGRTARGLPTGAAGARGLHASRHEAADRRSLGTCARSRRHSRTRSPRSGATGRALLASHHEACARRRAWRLFRQQNPLRCITDCGSAAAHPCCEGVSPGGRPRVKQETGRPPAGAPRVAEAGGRSAAAAC